MSLARRALALAGLPALLEGEGAEDEVPVQTLDHIARLAKRSGLGGGTGGRWIGQRGWGTTDGPSASPQVSKKPDSQLQEFKAKGKAFILLLSSSGSLFIFSRNDR